MNYAFWMRYSPGASINAQEAPSGEIEVVAENLNIPWSLALLPDGDFLVTERPGNLRKIGGDEFTIEIPEVEQVGEGGLLGLALHPDFQSNRQIYLYYTENNDGRLANAVYRYVLEGNRLDDRRLIIGNIPASANHNGGRLAFGPDRMLYVTTGDAQNEGAVQDVDSLGGKILRLREDGSFPDDNPFGNAIYAYGLRNPQGLAWDEQGRLWATDHGRSGLSSGLDELNLIESGKNYGWPEIEGDDSQAGLENPVIHSGLNVTWAPAGAAFRDGSVYFTGLRGEAVYRAALDAEGKVSDFQPLLENRLGRIRDIIVDGEGNFYITTSNTDGRGNLRVGDDKIIKIRKF